MLRVLNGGRRVDGRWLWRRVALDVDPGDRIALVGPSGSGKTLLLRAMVDLDPLDEGTVELDGEAVSELDAPAFRARVGYLPQEASLAEGTVEAALRRPFGFRTHEGRSYEREEALELLGRLGRGASFLEKRTEGLSGGERQIVALVRVLLVDPEVLLLDEPTASMDEELARGSEALVDAWMRDEPGRRALLWTSHSAHRLDRVADREVDIREFRP